MEYQTYKNVENNNNFEFARHHVVIKQEIVK